MLCVSLKSKDSDELFALAEIAKPFADIIELRLDGFLNFPSSDIATFIKKVPCIVSSVPRQEEKFLEIASYGPEWLDIPADMPISLFKKVATQFPRVKILVSYHNYENTPEDLESIFSKLAQYECAGIKIATTARCFMDSLRMLAFVKRHVHGKCFTGLCMGEKGVITRVLSSVVGSFFTYTCLEGRSTAPGQISVKELIEVYRVQKMQASTRVFALVGGAVEKSISHYIHNDVFDACGLDAVYTKISLSKEEFQEAFPHMKDVGFTGLSVTMPLKQAFDEKSEPYNTVLFSEEKMLLCNTDGQGMLDAIEKLGAVRGKRMILFGAGGAGRAIAKEAMRRGAHLIICNRTYKEAENFSQMLGCEVLLQEQLEEAMRQGYDIFINATSIGMKDDDMLPIDETLLTPKSIVADVVRIKNAPFTQAARRRGCTVISGDAMWKEQAVRQWNFWFGTSIDLLKIHKVLEAHGY